ncbi:dTDP-glucose 4,6-dehydratase [Pseudonocardia ailaonensis]|uniref:dTDP-glucose 4,6-dehydratase n=1 Tax=Pseudonocardia ailaonensis TaxID=367279 RepID=A0ABN2ND56_9PSEU
MVPRRYPRRVRVLVTGGAGFIGSAFVRSLAAGVYPGLSGEVRVLDLLTYAGRRENLAGLDVELRVGDVRDPAAAARAVEGCEVVVHFAAESHVDRSIAGAADFVSTNVVGTQVMLQAALDGGVRKFVHVSTDEVYGSIESGSWSEEHVLEPNSPYSASKAGSDLLARSYFRTHGLDVSVTRCSNNYGSHQFPEKVIPLFVTNLLDGRKVPLYGDGLNVRDWLHVSDHCAGIAAVAERGRAGEVYNIGGGTELTNRALTEKLLDAVGADWSSVEPVADRLGHDRRYSVDWSKIRDELGYEPRVSFEAGLADTVAWYQESRAWWEPLKAGAAR